MTIPALELRDGSRIPQLGFGVWQITGRRTVPTVAAALEAGYRHVDTAAAYGNERGVGEAIRGSGIQREDLFVTTKLDTSDMGRARAALEESLEELGLEQVDLYLIHWPVPRHRLRFDAWEAMQRAQADGLVRSIGVSNFTEKYLQELVDLGGAVPAVNQVEYHPGYQQRRLQQFAAEHGIATEAYSPLGMGSGPKNEAVARIADTYSRTPAQVILRWHLQQGRIAIPKTATASRIVENFAVTGFQLSADDMAAIDSLDTGRYVGWDPEHV
ncbi:aldo/keto reductase [Brachybacterium kimchii]|uniref:Aldo/keto reductase n=1 Tax=Brachybacterium kimchii TaxID=2942909 RepID=A0ABY4N8P2_9MICO|nr:aldo/keto reductase [Brachybacterium kimchii]UQN30912.1 aldo/keto reductase [Brachybacterium kimchii]